jgi:hypothetical protein
MLRYKSFLIHTLGIIILVRPGRSDYGEKNAVTSITALKLKNYFLYLQKG